jgi:hypothetical protein
MNIIFALFLRLLLGLIIYFGKNLWINWTFSFRMIGLSIMLLSVSLGAYGYLLKKGIQVYKNTDI